MPLWLIFFQVFFNLSQEDPSVDFPIHRVSSLHSLASGITLHILNSFHDVIIQTEVIFPIMTLSYSLVF